MTKNKIFNDIRYYDENNILDKYTILQLYYSYGCNSYWETYKTWKTYKKQDELLKNVAIIAIAGIIMEHVNKIIEDN